MATVLEAIVTPALQEAGVLAATDTATSEDAAFAFARLNRFLDRLAAENLTIYTRTRSTWSITPSDGSYTVGSGGDVAIARPIFVWGVSVIDTVQNPDAEYPLERLTEDEYRRLTLKDQTSSLPTHFYYNPTFALATLILWPAPTNSSLSGAIYHSEAVTQFAALSTTVSLPPAYTEMLVTNLAVLLGPAFKLPPDPILVRAASDSMAVLKRANRRPQEIRFGADTLFGQAGNSSYDIRRE